METDNLCIICLEEFTDNCNIYKLEECGHSFHNNCILKWFRCNHAECPYCKTIPEYEANNIFLSYLDQKSKIKHLRKYIQQNKNVPKDLVNIYDKLQKIKNILKNNKQNLKNFKNDTENADFLIKLKIFKKLRRDAHGWKIQQKIRTLESEIAQYPILPVIVKIKK